MLAKECKICIVPGTIVEAVSDEETGEDKLVNACYFINPIGEVIGRYEKKNLWLATASPVLLILCLP